MKKYLTSKVVGRATKKSSNRGASLPEVLIGAALITTMVAAAGYGLSSMVTASTASNARSDKRAEQNRSLDFVAAEIRESTSLVKDAQNAANPSGSSPTSYTFTPLGSGAIKVLMVNTATASAPVVYYVATPPAGAWKGPRVLYRWGPTFDAATGNYSNATTPGTWTSEVLIDNIPNASAATSFLGGIPGTDRNCTSTTAKPNNGGTYNGDSGFNACVDAAGRTAVIYQDGQIAKVLGASENYTASTNTGSRRLIASGPAARALPAGATSAGLTAGCFTKDSSGAVTICGTSQSITVTTIPTNGYPWATSVRVAKGTQISDFTNAFFTNSSNNSNLISIPANNTSASQSITLNVASGQMISIAGCSNGTGNMTGGFNTSNINYCPTSTAHQGATVYTFKQGDTVPAVAGAYASGVQQPSLRETITGSQSISTVPAYNASTGKGLKANELYYVYEIYTTATSGGNATYNDLQDIIVKVTVN
jgi:hypothetical protein